MKIALPIDPFVPRVVEALESGTALVLQASPGSGKTTRVPPALLKAKFVGGKEILVLEPRRLAAKWASRRVAEEMGEKAGETVGYQFRFENVSGPKTRLKFLTEGMLMRRLMGDPELKNVAAVLLDEFHERHLHGDLAISYLRWLQKSRRPDLRILVMSATLDTEALTRYLGDCPLLTLEARLHPVQTEFLPGPPARHLDLLVRDAVRKELTLSGGNILVFLPGMTEIRRAQEALGEFRQVQILPLHGELSREEQDLAMTPSEKRKIILATNIAETSLTIPGITCVIDSGLHRVASYSWWTGMPALKTRLISKASAIQRAGRAGRTGPGRCMRLYPKGDFETRAPFDVPEIQRADLTQTYLEMMALRIEDMDAFPWFEAPKAQSLEASRTLLYRLGALESDSASSGLTALGRRMAALPTHPRLARLLLEAEQNGLADEAASLCALLSEGRIESLDALSEIARPPNDFSFRKARDQLLSSLRKAEKKSGRSLAYCVLTAFPDRVARKRRASLEKETELLLSAGGTARVDNRDLVADHDTFVALDIQETQHIGQARAQNKVRSLVAIEEDWLLDLERSLLTDQAEARWNPDRKRVEGVSRLAYDQLVLSESVTESVDSNAASRTLLKHALGLPPDPALNAHDWIQALAPYADAEALESAFARVSLLSKHVPDVPDPAAQVSWERFRSLFEGKMTANELRETDWPREIPLALAGAHAGRLAEWLPETITLPRGRKPKVIYKLGHAPWIESRLQDFLGMKQGPKILGGKVSLTIHLLAPNYRAVQVTTDLAGFWERTYPEVRKELHRRYPRHAWPEDPFSA